MAETSPPDAVFRIFIQADIQRVWRELTKTGEAQGALFNAWLHSNRPAGLATGAHIQMRTGTGKHVLVDGEVLVFEPPYRYGHTHRFTQYDDPVCQVAYELKPVGTGVEVTLRVIGIPADSATGKAMASGGPQILQRLKAITETGRPDTATRLLYWLFDRLEFVLPARTRRERWPLKPVENRPNPD